MMRSATLLLFLALSCPPLQAGDTHQMLFDIARGEGDAQSWNRERALKVLREQGTQLIPLYLDLDRLQAEMGLPSTRWQPDESILRAASALSESERRQVLLATLSKEGGVERLLAAWNFVSGMDDTRSTAFLFELASRMEGEFLASRRVQRAYEQHVMRILKRAGSPALQDVDSSPEILDRALVAAVQVSLGGEAFSSLLDLADRRASLRQAVLQIVPRLDLRVRARSEEDLVSWLHEQLEASDSNLRRLAASALGQVGNLESVERLVASLASELDERAAAKTVRSLERLTQASFGTDLEAWDSWLTAEHQWISESWSDLRSRLTATKGAVVLGALRELDGARPRPDLTLGTLLPLLDSDDPAIAAAAARSLQRQGDARALPRLMRCLDSDQQAIQQAAWTALRDLSNQDLPQDARAWRAWFQGSGDL